MPDVPSGTHREYFYVFRREIVGQEYTDLTTGLHQHKDEWGATGFLPKGSKTVFENGNMLFQGPV